MMASNRIETLIGKGDWKSARRAIEKQLDREPDDHWLWSRLSAVKYEQRDYEGALAAAEKALEMVPDCPLALWSYANALDMLGRQEHCCPEPDDPDACQDDHRGRIRAVCEAGDEDAAGDRRAEG